MKMAFKDYFGTSQIDPEQTEAFIKAWFHPEDDVLITLLPAIEGSGNAMSITLKARDLAQATVENIESLGKYKNNLYGIYFGVSPLREDHQVKLYSRGGKKDVREIYGAWVDLDVKPGAFESREAIYTFLDTLALEPSIVVNNGGTGGIHAYWRLNWGESAPEDLPLQWWSYLNHMAGGREIDRLNDSSRLMRLPGAVYYPKPGGLSGTVQVARLSGKTYKVGEIEAVSHVHYQDYLAKRSQIRQRSERTQSDLSVQMLSFLRESGDLTCNQRLARAILEQKIEEMSWDDILIPAGWTFLNETHDGERHWARPGTNRKSAHTDWNGSNVMSLHSWSEETRLADLREAGIALTKPVVLLRLRYNDDVAAMIDDLKEKL